MRRVLPLLVALLGSHGARADFAQGETLFQKGLYQQALDQFEATAKPDAPEAFQSFYRIQETRALLFRYGEAAQSLHEASPPSDPILAAHFLLLRAEIGREFLKQYAHSAPKEQAADTKDVTRWTTDEWRSRIEHDYFALLPLRDRLIATPLVSQSFFVSTKGADLETLPTVWDFAVHRWTEYLLAEAPDSYRPNPLDWVDSPFDAEISPQSPPARLALSLWADAAKRPSAGAGPSRAKAQETWMLQLTSPPWGTHESGESADPRRVRLAKRLEDLSAKFTVKPVKARAASMAAAIFVSLKNYQEAVRLCRHVETIQPTSDCARIRNEIETPRLELEAFPTGPTSAKKVSIRTRSVPKVFLRLYPTSGKDLAELAPKRTEEKMEWSELRLLEITAAQSFLRSNPVFKLTVEPKPGAPFDWVQSDAELPPALPPGLYVVLASETEDFTAGAKFLRGAILNITELYLFADRPIDSKKGQNALLLRVLDGQTGEPVAGASTTVLVGNPKKPKPLEASTDAQGSIYLVPPPNQVDPLVKKGKSQTFLPGPLWLGPAVKQARTLVHIDTDRPIYRPGQRVAARITAFRSDATGLSALVKPEIEFRAQDANGKTFFRKRLQFNSWGNAEISFTLPRDGLLGQYSLTASGREAGTNAVGAGYAQVRVEEYLRPDFEVVLDAPNKTWLYGSLANVTGTATAYSGPPVSGATVKYRIFREPYFAPYWGYFPGPAPFFESEQVVTGVARTDATGRFTFSFRPEADAAVGPRAMTRYRVETTVLGTSGKSVRMEREYLAAPAEFALVIRMEKGFFSVDDSVTAEIKAVSPENTPVDSWGRAQVFALDLDTLEKPGRDFEAARLSEALAKLETGRLLQDKSVKLLAGTAVLTLAKQPPGAYRLRVDGKDSQGHAITAFTDFVVWGKGPALPAIAAADKARYQIGESARILLGSSDLKRATFLEIWRGEERLHSRLLPGGLQVHTVPISKEYRGGVTIRWFGVANHEIRSGETRLEVPWSDRVLKMRISSPKSAIPASTADWKLELLDDKGRKVDAEALVRVTDRSLDALVPPPVPWVESLYPVSSSPVPQNQSYAPAFFAWLRDRVASPSPPVRDTPTQLPALRPTKSRYGYGGSMAMSYARSAFGKAAQVMADSSKEPEGNAPSEPAQPIRRDFRETAFFAPRLAVRGGNAKVRFTFPDSTTSWAISGFALDKDFRWATVRSEVATKLDFYVHTSVPRFLREGDETSLRVVLHNTTAGTLSGKLSARLEFRGAGETKTTALPDKDFRISRDSSVSLTWPLFVPMGVGEVRIVTQARAGKLHDSEEHTVAWLPGRQRQAESRVAAVTSGGTASLSLPPLPKDASVESITLQVDPQVISSILSSLPALIQSTGHDVVSVVNRYLPAAIAHRLFKQMPELDSLLKKMPKRKTRFVPWEDDPRRLTRLEETPWLELAEGGGAADTLLWDTGSLDRLARKTWAKLEQFQKPSGAFCWFPGGPDDVYLTLYVLSQLADAKRHGVEFPGALTQRALPFLKKNLPEWLEPEPASLSQSVFAAHVLAALYETSATRDFVNKAIDFADKHSDALTPLGRALLSDAAFRIGRTEVGNRYADLAMDGARENEWGLYWTPEKVSWVWYSDTLQKHSTFLRLLLDWKPDDPRIDKIVRWVLFNRKTSVWTDSRTAASVVTSLLQYQKRSKTLFEKQQIRWTWDGRSERIPLDANTLVESALRWTKSGKKPGTAALAATVEKTGPSLAFASLTAIFSSTETRLASSGPVHVRTELWERVDAQKGAARLKPLGRLGLGAEVQAQLVIRSDVPLEYVKIALPRAAGLEPMETLSGWKWEKLGYYREVRDASDSIFIPRLPAGEFVLPISYFATTSGSYRFGEARLQSLYSPDLTASCPAHSLVIK